jgi:hypothetical protein
MYCFSREYGQHEYICHVVDVHSLYAIKNMKKLILYLFILIIPILGMIIINELVRINTKEEGFNKQGIMAINTAKQQKDKCSWICHNDTDYCKEHHVKLAKPYFDQIDPIYFGIIASLKSTGNYALANILFLVILLPLMMYGLLVKSIQLQFEIRRFKKS